MRGSTSITDMPEGAVETSVVFPAGKKGMVQGLTIYFRKLCFMCGGNKDLTKHHCIPKAMKPKFNFTIPLCRPCHDVWHEHHKQVVLDFDLRALKDTAKDLQWQITELKEDGTGANTQ